MADKRKTNFPLPDDTDNTFEDNHFILNYRPLIEFVEPEQDSSEPGIPSEPVSEVPTIDSLRDRTQKLINGLEAAAKLADLAQKRVDNRVKVAGGSEKGSSKTGGLTIKLDPKKDAMTIAAMKRRFPKKEDPTQITYDDYKKCIDCINKSTPPQPTITAEDLRAAQSDPTRTNFGGYNNQQGENRAEISSPISTVEPLDLNEFQKTAVLSLFALMRPLIKLEDKLEIAKHLVTAPHI